MRLFVIAFALVVLLAMAACTDAQPCHNCPPVDGVYSVTWGDAGVASTCPGPKPPSWTITGETQLITQVNDITLGGTLYDTYDLLMTGTKVGLSYRMRSLVIPEGTTADAGIRMTGTFTTRTVPTEGDPCEANETFTAQRTSR
jgi:hypothetical protein